MYMTAQYLYYVTYIYTKCGIEVFDSIHIDLEMPMPSNTIASIDVAWCGMMWHEISDVSQFIHVHNVTSVALFDLRDCY